MKCERVSWLVGWLVDIIVTLSVSAVLIGLSSVTLDAAMRLSSLLPGQMQGFFTTLQVAIDLIALLSFALLTFRLSHVIPVLYEM